MMATSSFLFVLLGVLLASGQLAPGLPRYESIGAGAFFLIAFPPFLWFVLMTGADPYRGLAITADGLHLTGGGFPRRDRFLPWNAPGWFMEVTDTEDQLPPAFPRIIGRIGRVRSWGVGGTPDVVLTPESFVDLMESARAHRATSMRRYGSLTGGSYQSYRIDLPLSSPIGSATAH